MCMYMCVRGAGPLPPCPPSLCRDVCFCVAAQAQGIVPPEQWDAFIATLKLPLPVSFRISSLEPEANAAR